MSSYIYKGWKAQGWRSGGRHRNFFAVYIGTHACVPAVGVAVVFRVAWRLTSRPYVEMTKRLLEMSDDDSAPYIEGD